MTQKLQEFKTRIEKMLELAHAGAIDLSTVDGASTCLSELILIYVYEQALADINNHRLNTVNENFGYYNKRSIESQFILDNVERSYAVSCQKDGNYSLIVEVKSKLPNNQKRIIDIKHGSSKTLKGAYSIDSGITPIGALTTKINKKHPKFAQAIKFRDDEEIYNNMLAAIHPQNFIHMHTIIEDRDNIIKYHTYMDCKDFDLNQILTFDDEKILQQFPNIKKTKINVDDMQISVWKLDVFNKILNAVNVIHAQQICHGDLKTENILCNFNADTGLFDIWIIDFGNAEKFGHKEAPLGATSAYRSPEFWLHCALRNFKSKSANATKSDIQQFLYSKIDKSLGLVKARQLITDANFNPNDYVEYSVNCGEYDMWSLGIILLELFDLSLEHIPPVGYGLFELSHQLLSIDPKARLTANAAIQKINPTMESITEYFATSASKRINLSVNAAKNSTHMLNAIDKMQSCALLFSSKFAINNASFEAVTNELMQYLKNPFELLSNPNYFDQINNFLNVMKNYINSYLKNMKNISVNTNYLRMIQEAIQDSIKALQSDASANNFANSSSNGVNKVPIDPDLWMSKNIIIDLLEFLNNASLMLEAALTENNEQIRSIYATMLKVHLKNAKLAESNQRMSFNNKFGL